MVFFLGSVFTFAVTYYIFLFPLLFIDGFFYTYMTKCVHYLHICGNSIHTISICVYCIRARARTLVCNFSLFILSYIAIARYAFLSYMHFVVLHTFFTSFKCEQRPYHISNICSREYLLFIFFASFSSCFFSLFKFSFGRAFVLRRNVLW